MKHTKGNWKVVEKSNFESFMISSDKAKKVNGKSLFIAKIKYEEPWQDKFVSNMGRPEVECRRRRTEAEANAKLIAAAPKMLEALENLSIEVQKSCPMSSDALLRRLFLAHQEALQVIEKATS